MRSKSSGAPGSGRVRRALQLAGALTCLHSTRELNAQPMLDTAGALLRTAKVAGLGPSAKDKWLFTLVTEVAVDARGQIYVLDPIECAVRVFSRSGAFVRTLGRKGAGPGELDRPRYMQVLGDTLFVRDTGNGRYVAFSTVTGAALHNRRDSPALGGVAIGLSPVGMYQLSGDVDGGSSRRAVPLTISHADNGTKSWRTLVKLVKAQGSLEIPVYRDRLPAIASVKAGGRMSAQQPFDDTPLYHVAPDGRSLMVIERAFNNGSLLRDRRNDMVASTTGAFATRPLLAR